MSRITDLAGAGFVRFSEVRYDLGGRMHSGDFEYRPGRTGGVASRPGRVGALLLFAATASIWADLFALGEG